jgi:PAS domain S-box-containing protein
MNGTLRMDDVSVAPSLHDSDRLNILHALGLLGSPPDPAFDRLTRLVTRVLQVPVSLFSLVEADQQWFASLVGLPEPWCSSRQTPLSHSFCQFVVADRAPFVVADARLHPRVANSLAIPDLGVVAYAGVPLITPEGAVLGALCAIDHTPREWSDTDLALLTDLAAVMMTEIALRRSQQAEQRASTAQHRLEAKLAAVLAHVSDAVWSVDRAYHITAYNQVSAVLFASLAGTPFQPDDPLAHVSLPEQYLAWVAHYDRAFAGEAFTIEDTIILNGVQHWFELAFSPVSTETGVERVAVVSRDTTARRDEAETLRRLAAENARLYADEQAARLRAERVAVHAAQRSALTAALSEVRTPDQVAELAVSQGAEALGAYAGVFAVLTDAEDGLRTVAAVGYPPGLIAAWPVVPADAPLPIAVTARTREPVWLPDRAAMAAAYPMLLAVLAPNTKAQVAVPLVVGDALLGVIGLSFDRPQPFTSDDRDLIMGIAQQCAQVLDRAHLFESLQRELAERRQVEATLRLHDRAIAASRNGILITDARQPDHPIIYCNPAFTTLTGYPAEAILGRNSRFLQGSETDRATVALLHNVIATGEPVQAVIRNYRRDGTPFWNELAIAPVHDEAGQLTHFVGIQTDVTARVEATEALRASEERFARAFAASPVALSISTLAEGRLLEANHSFVELSGFAREKLIGQSIHDLAIWDERTDRELLVRLLGEQPTIRDLEIRFRTKHGGIRTGLVAATTIELGGERCLLIQMQDITAWKATETALRASEARFRSLAQSAPDCIYVLDMATRDLIYCNRESLLGYSMAVLRQPGGLFAHIHTDDKAALFSHWGTLISAPDDANYVIEYRMRRADGAWEWLQNRGVVLSRDDTGQPSQLMVSISIITGRKQAEEERRALDRAMLETQKLESLGVLAGGIAHDFNNMLVSILGNAELALLDLPAQHPATPSVTQLQIAARRAAELTGQLLAYSGRGRFVVGPLDLAQLVHEMTALVRASIPRTVTLDYHLAAGLPPVEGDATQLRQVVMNLVINAAEAVGSAGSVSVRLQQRAVDPSFFATCVLGTDAAPGQYLVLEVTDTGSGMDEVTMRRIFEPFFTTKFTGRGLGMAAVQGIVRAHHGAIHIASMLQRGTTITILLPVAATQLIALSSPPATQLLAADDTPHTILVVDDEPGVREVTARMLERLGYHVVTAEDGTAGLAMLEREPTITGVLLDLTMPDLSGEETFQRLRQQRPELPVVVVSGYSEQEVRGRLSGAERIGVLQKPFTPTTLRQALTGLLVTRK